MSYDSVFKPGLFSGQTILVTGGGSGIGRCVAHELAHLGAHVVLVGRKLEKLEKTTGEIAEDGGSASFAVCDIREEEAVKTMVKAVVAERGPIHHLVNNAGGQFPAPLVSINQKGFETVVRTNLVGGFLIAREVFSQSMSKTGGSIVNMLADMWGGMPGMGHSGAARAGMENFTKTAAYEWGHAGVRVNAVAPGWIASSGMDTYPESMKNMIRNLKDHVPLQRIGTESEVAAAIVFLLSPGANFISGNTIRIDGAASQGTRAWTLGKASSRESYNGFHRAYVPDVLKDQGE
ncbi:SDR family oxidoreductase [Aquipseudomonas ullengensis]|uniref:Peroxisomal trans-2-enoyl-CoA reductase n=1 Tax=Aquipseudomonas ullengensis TaxID=2759166 RepID=A0A7W4LLB4_9GAMM|nr:SDR family oxidoreductase [Pseudomonas ullengensis]MBB2495082.1 SDR family oxidoreductase [Pseudomonas ullengensis]